MPAALPDRPPPNGLRASENHADRRRSPRHAALCNALIRLSSSLTFRCQVRNLSLDAAQIVCDPRYALLIHPRSGPVHPGQARSVELSVAVPLDGTVRGLRMRCRARYCEPVADGLMMIMGLQFVDLDTQSRLLLAGFLGGLRPVNP
jgi:hypothetical protein